MTTVIVFIRIFMQKKRVDRLQSLPNSLKSRPSYLCARTLMYKKGVIYDCHEVYRYSCVLLLKIPCKDLSSMVESINEQIPWSLSNKNITRRNELYNWKIVVATYESYFCTQQIKPLHTVVLLCWSVQHAGRAMHRYEWIVGDQLLSARFQNFGLPYFEDALSSTIMRKPFSENTNIRFRKCLLLTCKVFSVYYSK